MRWVFIVSHSHCTNYTRTARSFKPRLLLSPILVAVLLGLSMKEVTGLSVGYETWSLIGSHHPLCWDCLSHNALSVHMTSGDFRHFSEATDSPLALAPGNPMLWRGVPVAPIQKSFGSSGRDWKPGKKLPIPCKFCTYRLIRYSSTCYGKVRIDPLMANIRNTDYFASPVVNAAWLVVVLPCYLNRDLLSGPKGN